MVRVMKVMLQMSTKTKFFNEEISKKYHNLAFEKKTLPFNGWNKCVRFMAQSELPRPISWNSAESDLRCTSRIYFDNMKLTLHNVTLTSQKPCQHYNKCECSKTNGYDEVCFLIK